MIVAPHVELVLGKLVGTPELADQLETDLRSQVRADIANGIVPYESLENRVCQAIFAVVQPTMIEPVVVQGLGSVGAYEIEATVLEWDKIPHVSSDHEKATTTLNAVTGTSFLIRGLAGLGRVYNQRASTPQERRNVARNTSRVIRHYQRIAFLDQVAADISVDAFAAGADPRMNFKVPDNPEVDENSFVVADDDGQLGIDIRYKNLAVKQGHQACPATAVQVMGYERSRSGLLAYGHVIGAVSIDPILASMIAIQ